MLTLLSWLLEKTLGTLPFLYGRGKSRQQARAKLNILRAQLVLYAIHGTDFTGRFDPDLTKWAVSQLGLLPNLPAFEPYLRTKEVFEVMLQHQKATQAYTNLMTPSKRGITKLLPELDMPNLIQDSFSADDAASLSALGVKLKTINASCRRIESLHNQTFDNDLTDYQKNAINTTMHDQYLSISRQSRLAADIIGSMSIVKTRMGRGYART